ncbi:MAG TPA: ATP-binding protein [Terriglobales bacterium]|jgi:signal transduction histidine kinase|nr:ATP-binding protein [Terriglobales bacterium]
MPDTQSHDVQGAAEEVTGRASETASDAPRRSVRISWEIKAVLPVAVVLLNGLVLFLLATVSLEKTERHAVLLVASSGAVAICAVMILVLAVLIHRPVRELQEKIARVGTGDLDTEVKFARRNDEIGDLGRNFNQMVRQLRESRDEIQRLHQTQMSRAEHLATMGELAAGLAHEIRNPLAGIAGVIEIIGRDLPASSPARAVVKEVRQEVMQINRIVSDLLECARPKPPETRLSDLHATVEHAVMFARQQALSKSIDVEFHHDPLPLEVEHDSNQVNQVLLNLLLNSIQSIDHRGKITVTVERHSQLAAISVADTGRGIAPEHLPHIFRPFYTTKGNGTGLGLSLARRIVEEHGGRMEVSSTLGHGSTFIVFLPLRRASAHAAD